MRIARFNEGRIGIVLENDILDVTSVCGIDLAEWPPVGPTRLIADFDRHRIRIEEEIIKGGAKSSVDEVRLASPVPWPNKVIAFPVNFQAHRREMQASYQANNRGFFLKPNSSLSGAGDPIVLPELPGRQIHHECELAVIIGKPVRNLHRSQWRDAVFGYSCLIDMVVRGREERVMRKAYDSFCPVGPWIITADELGDPSALDLSLWVNGELRQSANTRDLILDIPGMIEMASAVMTLYPGDIIASGTPDGVGPVSAGDKIRIEIEGVGGMTIDVVQGKDGFTTVFAENYEPQIAKE